MMKVLETLSDGAYRFAKARYIVPCLVAFLAVLAFMEMSPIGMMALKRLSGGVGMLDMSFGYAPATVDSMFETLGADGRLLYARLLCLDFGFMFAYTALQALLISALLRKAGAHGRLLRLNLIPFARSALDVVENFLLLFFLARYPLSVPALVVAASGITAAKLALNYGYIALVFSLGALTSVRPARIGGKS